MKTNNSEIFQNFEDFSDEDKSFSTWIFSINPDKFLQYVYNNNIKDLKNSYVAGFAAGLQHKQKISAQEQLQK